MYKRQVLITGSKDDYGRMELTKSALASFVESLADHDGVVNITLIGFAGTVTLSYEVDDLSSDDGLNDLLAQINKLNAEGGTNYESGFVEASDWFDEQDAKGYSEAAGYENLTYFLTDGEPTYYLDEHGNLKRNDSTTSDNVLYESLDTFNELAAKSDVHAIGIGDGVNTENLDLFDNTTDDPGTCLLYTSPSPRDCS